MFDTWEEVRGENTEKCNKRNVHERRSEGFGKTEFPITLSGRRQKL